MKRKESKNKELENIIKSRLTSIFKSINFRDHVIHTTQGDLMYTYQRFSNDTINYNSLEISVFTQLNKLYKKNYLNAKEYKLLNMFNIGYCLTTKGSFRCDLYTDISNKSTLLDYTPSQGAEYVKDLYIKGKEYVKYKNYMQYVILYDIVINDISINKVSKDYNINIMQVIENLKQAYLLLKDFKRKNANNANQLVI